MRPRSRSASPSVSDCSCARSAWPPTTKVLDCTTGGCHAKEMDHKFLHGPMAVSACDSCHEYEDPVAHAFNLKRPGRELCDFCHIDKTGTEGPYVHKPVADGDCTGCHDPHGASSRRMLKAATTPELCVTCHKDQKEKLGNKLVKANPLEPAPVDCKNGVIQLSLQVAYDNANAYFRAQWKTRNPYPGEAHPFVRYDGKEWKPYGFPKLDAVVRKGQQLKLNKLGGIISLYFKRSNDDPLRAGVWKK